MKQAKDYAQTLKKLIESTDIKMLFVAKTVGYDISYISKWCGGKNLPTQKNKDKINENLACLFAGEYISKGFTHILKEDFDIDIKDPLNMQEVQKSIYKLLNISYEHSKMNLPNQNNKRVNRTGFLTGNQEVLFHFINTLKSVVELSDYDIELLATVDLCSILKQMRDEAFPSFRLKDIKVNARFCVNMEGVKEDPDNNIKNIYYFLNSHTNCNIWLYDQQMVAKNNVFVIKNHVAFLFSIDQDGRFIFASETWDTDIVNNIYDLTAEFFDARNILVKPEAIDELAKKDYRLKFYSTNDFCSFNAFGFEYLLPTDIADIVAKFSVEYSGNSDMENYIKKLQITWEECFANGKITFILPKSNILHYIEHGKIYYLDIPFTLTIEQRRRHIRHIVGCMRENPQIQLFVFDDDEISNTDFDYNISLYYNYRKVYMKRNGDVFDSKGSDLYYVILDNWMLQYMSTFLNTMYTGTRCKVYGADEISEMIEKYEPMFLRLFDI